MPPAPCNGAKVLIVVEDGRDPAHLSSLRDVLHRAEYATKCAVGVSQAQDRLESDPPDWMLLLHRLDVPSSMMELCHSARSSKAVPVVVGVPWPASVDGLLAFDGGASVQLSWGGPGIEVPGAEQRHAGPVSVDLLTRQATVHGAPVHLSRLEFDLLAYLLDPPDHVRRRDEIHDAVWGERPRPGSRSLDAHIRRLRLKLGDDSSRPRLVKTVHGLGFRFDSRGADGGAPAE